MKSQKRTLKLESGPCWKVSLRHRRTQWQRISVRISKDTFDWQFLYFHFDVNFPLNEKFEKNDKNY